MLFYEYFNDLLQNNKIIKTRLLSSKIYKICLFEVVFQFLKDFKKINILIGMHISKIGIAWYIHDGYEYIMYSCSWYILIWNQPVSEHVWKFTLNTL